MGRERYRRFDIDPDRLSIGDVLSLPFADNTFNLVFGKTVFEHFDDPEGAVAEIHRVLAPGGKVILDVPNLRNAYWTKASERARGHRHKTDYFTIERFSGYFEAAGFRVTQTWGDALFYMTPYILINELCRWYSSGDETTESKPVGEVGGRLPSGPGGAGSLVMFVDGLAKRLLRGTNGIANRTPLVTPNNGVLIGVIAEKPGV